MVACRCRPRPCRACRPCSACSTGRCRGTSRRGGRASASPGSDGIERRVGPLRIARDAARRGELRVVVGPVPVAHPLPHVAGHVVEAVAVGRKLRDRRDPDEAVLAGVAVRESGPGRCSPSMCRRAELVAPGVELAARARRARRTPTRPRSAAACRPIARTPPRPRRRRARPGIARVPSIVLSGPCGMPPVRALARTSTTESGRRAAPADRAA